MERKIQNDMEAGVYRGYLWLAGNAGAQKKMESTTGPGNKGLRSLMRKVRTEKQHGYPYKIP